MFEIHKYLQSIIAPYANRSHSLDAGVNMPQISQISANLRLRLQQSLMNYRNDFLKQIKQLQ